MSTMAKPKALKVFRTVAGFRDAYVATSTKKAALEAWGSTRNLFALGEAEQVTDPALCKAPLAQPGKVIQISRGTMAQQLAALPVDQPDVTKPKKRVVASPPAVPRRVLPRPTRAALEGAEARLSAGKRKADLARAQLQTQIDVLKREIVALDAQWDREAATLEKNVSNRLKAYDKTLARWQAAGS
jgi:hypothetical protein